jgi:mRNA interferase MazF
MKGAIVLIQIPLHGFFCDKTSSSHWFSMKINMILSFAFISSKIPPDLSQPDIPVLQQHRGFAESGLKVDSVIKPDKIATIMKKYGIGELGELTLELRAIVNEKMKEIYQISDTRQ